MKDLKEALITKKNIKNASFKWYMLVWPVDEDFRYYSKFFKDHVVKSISGFKFFIVSVDDFTKYEMKDSQSMATSIPPEISLESAKHYIETAYLNDILDTISTQQWDL